MTTLRDEFEALMPEPVGFRSRYRSEPEMIGHYPWTWAGAERRRRKYDRVECEYEDLYTADQMRKAISDADQAATERAAKEREELLAALEGLSAMYTHAWDLVDGGLVMMGESIPLFEQRHKAAAKAIKRAAAIRGAK